MGCGFVRRGATQDWNTNYKTNVSQPVPRHSEINEYLAKSILKKLKKKKVYYIRVRSYLLDGDKKVYGLVRILCPDELQG